MIWKIWASRFAMEVYYFVDLQGGVMLKKSLYTILLVIAVNMVLFLAHVFAIFGLAFNDSSAEFSSVVHLLPNLIFCVGPLAVGSYFLIRFLAKKIDCYEPVLHVVQGILVVCYIVSYIDLYVPNSLLRKVSDSVTESRAEKRQEKQIMSERNEKESLEETPPDVFVYDITDGELYIYALNDNGLETLVIPNEIEGYPVREFDANYIADNGTIHTIVIPPNVTRLVRSFHNMDALTTLLVREGNARFTSRDVKGRECNAIFEKGTGVLVYGCRTTEIPAEITTIGEYAFADCAGLTEIVIPDNVKRIEDAAFSGAQLRRIVIPNSIVSLGGWAFCECYDLEEIVLSEALTEIQPYTFATCESLEKIEIPEGVVKMAEGAFKDSALEQITLPESLKIIEEDVFLGCDKIQIIAPEGSYAEIWARENGYPVSYE